MLRVNLGQFQTAKNGAVFKGNGIDSLLRNDFFRFFANVALRHDFRQAVFCADVQPWHGNFTGSVRGVLSHWAIANPGHPFFHVKRDACNLSVLTAFADFQRAWKRRIVNPHCHFAAAGQAGYGKSWGGIVAVFICRQLVLLERVAVGHFAALVRHGDAPGIRIGIFARAKAEYLPHRVSAVHQALKVVDAPTVLVVNALPVAVGLIERTGGICDAAPCGVGFLIPDTEVVALQCAVVRGFLNPHVAANQVVYK